MQVQEIMSENVAFCTPQTSLRDVARMMADRDCGIIPVVESEDNRRVIGVITDRDITCRTVAEGKNPLEMTAGDCLSAPVFVVTPEMNLEECCHLLEDHQVRRAVVVDNSGNCRGIVSQADIARRSSEHDTAEVVGAVSRPTPAANA